MACEWLLVDGSSLIFRAYYGALASTRVSGTDGNAIGGFLDRLARLVTDRRPRRLAVIDEAEITRRYAIPGRRYADFAILRGDPSDGLPGLKGVGAVTAAAMIRRHGDIAGVLRERALRASDREYLQAATTVVRPVDDLPVALPPGQRDAYPIN